MSFFDNFSRKVGKVASDAAVKSRELADIARFSVSIADERAAIRIQYRDLGECYYKQLRQHDLTELQPYCAAIDQANNHIQELEHKIRLVKGIQSCPACGAESDRKARFCAACGAVLPQEPDQAIPEPDETAASEN